MASSPFPLELWFHVVEYLELDDFLSLATTCKAFNALLSSKTSWLTQAYRIRQRRPLPLSSRVSVASLTIDQLKSAVIRGNKLERNWRQPIPRVTLLHKFSIDQSINFYQHILLLNPSNHMLVLEESGTLSYWNAATGECLSKCQTGPNPSAFSICALDTVTTFVAVGSGSEELWGASPTRLHGLFLKVPPPGAKGDISFYEIFNKPVEVHSYDIFLRSGLCGLVISLGDTLGIELVNWMTLEAVTINCGVSPPPSEPVHATFTAEHMHIFLETTGPTSIYTYSTSSLLKACSLSNGTTITLRPEFEKHYATPPLPPPLHSFDGYVIISKPWITADGVIDARIPILSLGTIESATHPTIERIRYFCIDPLEESTSSPDHKEPFNHTTMHHLPGDIDIDYDTDVLELGTAGVAAVWSVDAKEARQFWLVSFDRKESSKEKEGHLVRALVLPMDISKEGHITSMDFDDVTGMLVVAVEGGHFYLFDLA